MGPCDLADAIKGITPPDDPAVIVGLGSNDDAGVIRLGDDIALIQTVDFITPLVDDPYAFGMIAACNSLSDVYAMGGVPYTALNIVCFPTEIFSLDVLREVLAGGLEICTRAGCRLLGGHSVTDKEMKFGLSVTGLVHPDKVLLNRGIRAGDVLVLTKPLGTGVIATAVKAGLSGRETVEPFIRSMTSLNDTAARITADFPVHACTDVTGFGLAGHISEMLGNENIIVEIDSAAIPLLPGAAECARNGLIPGGRYKNEDFTRGLFSSADGIPREMTDLVFDPQTSGGLLISLPEKDGVQLVARLRDAGIRDAAIVAAVAAGDIPIIKLK